MPPPAYTARVLGGTFNDATPLVSVPVPPGIRWVVINIILTPAAGPGSGNVLVYVPGPLYLVVRAMSGINSDLQVPVHQVVDTGETITCESVSSGNTYSALITGYELSTT